MKKAGKKALRQSKKREAFNRKMKVNLEYLIKKCRMAAAKKNKKEAQNLYKNAVKSLDKAAQKKIIKKNTAARLKSRLAKQINAL